MTPVPYVLKGNRSNSDGKFYGWLANGGTTIASVVEGTDHGFRSENDLEKWARGQALAHKASISPPDRHYVEKEFVL